MTEPAEKPVEKPIGCTDGCKRRATQEEAEQMAWRFLEISKRWRCPSCARELQEANDRINAQQSP